MRRELLVTVSVLLACGAKGGPLELPPGVGDEGSTGTSSPTTSQSDEASDGPDTSASATGAPGTTGDGSATTETGADGSGSDGATTTGDTPLEPTIPADSVLLVRFDDSAVGQYGVGAWAQDWNDPDWENGVSEGRAEIIADGHTGRAMRVHTPAATFGPDSGAQWHLPLGQNYDALYVGFWIRFGDDFDFVNGGKIVGLAGGSVHHAGTTPNGADGWNYRGAWVENGVGAFQIYHVEQSGMYGDQFDWINSTARYFEPGQWHHVQHRVVMNTPGSSDGTLQAWLDGELAFEAVGLRFRDGPALAIDALRFSCFFGGGDSSYNSSKPEYVDFDDFVISEDPILVPAG